MAVRLRRGIAQKYGVFCACVSTRVQLRVCRTFAVRAKAVGMARTLRDTKLDTRASRRRLRKRREPHWRSISGGLAVGYRKGVKGGSWIARHYSAEHGRRYHSIGTADDIADADGAHVLSFAQALEIARKWFADLARRDRGEVSGGPYTVRECLEEYLTWLQGHRKTGSDARYRTNTHIAPKLGDIQCNRLTTSEIQKWLRDLANSPARLRSRKDAKKPNFRQLIKGDDEAIRRRRASANRTLTVLKAALNRAWREGKTSSDDAWRRVEPFEKADGARVRYLTVAEARRLLNVSGPEFRRLAQAALATGARYGELAALRASDFNPDSGTIHVRTSKSGKGRHIVLNDEGAALFKSLAAGKSGDALLLVKVDGSPWNKSHQARPMIEACKQAKIRPPVSFHILRHTWASLAVMAGAPLMVVARNLGHADTRMVERHYGHLAPSYIADAIRAAAPKFGIKPERKVVSIDGRI
jgi:integrase